MMIEQQPVVKPYHSRHDFERLKCAWWQVKFTKYVFLVTQMDDYLLEKQILKIIIDIVL